MDIYTQFKGIHTGGCNSVTDVVSLSPPLHKAYFKKRLFQCCDAHFNVH